jgi:hypothetical protein
MPASGAWFLVRPITGSGKCDAMAGDRLLFCAGWQGLAADLDAIHDLVSVTAVTDPFADVSPDHLRRCFPDLVRPYKEHYVIDLRSPKPSPHHRAKARKAFLSLETSVSFEPSAYLDEWESLYSELRSRHKLAGMRAYSRATFQGHLALPGCVAIRALQNGRPVSMSLWYVMGDVVHYHLSASNAPGYELSATYALIQTAIDTFRGKGLRWLNLGAGPGARTAHEDGLGRFKRGWTAATRPTFLCGRVFDHDEYRRLAGAEFSDQTYFPAYRRGEFG